MYFAVSYLGVSVLFCFHFRLVSIGPMLGQDSIHASTIRSEDFEEKMWLSGATSRRIPSCAVHHLHHSLSDSNWTSQESRRRSWLCKQCRLRWRSGRNFPSIIEVPLDALPYWKSWISCDCIWLYSPLRIFDDFRVVKFICESIHYPRNSNNIQIVILFPCLAVYFVTNAFSLLAKQVCATM